MKFIYDDQILEVLNSTISYNLKTHVSIVCIGDLQCLKPLIDVLNLKNIKDDKNVRSFRNVLSCRKHNKKLQSSSGPGVYWVGFEIYGKSFRIE